MVRQQKEFDDDLYEQLHSLALKRRIQRVNAAKLPSEITDAWMDYTKECKAAFEQAEA